MKTTMVASVRMIIPKILGVKKAGVALAAGCLLPQGVTKNHFQPGPRLVETLGGLAAPPHRTRRYKPYPAIRIVGTMSAYITQMWVMFQ